MREHLQTDITGIDEGSVPEAHNHKRYQILLGRQDHETSSVDQRDRDGDEVRIIQQKCVKALGNECSTNRTTNLFAAYVSNNLGQQCRRRVLDCQKPDSHLKHSSNQEGIMGRCMAPECEVNCRRSTGSTDSRPAPRFYAKHLADSSS